jgi:multidrug efflux pump subunit AcrA (membrane-fusion protein)
VAAGLLYWYWPAAKRPVEVETDAGAEMRADLVTLADEKLASLGIRVAPGMPHPLQEMHVVPGRIMYDETRRVDIRVATDGILMQVCVAPGDSVSTGQVLAIFELTIDGKTRPHAAKLSPQKADPPGGSFSPTPRTSRRRLIMSTSRRGMST